MGHPGLAEVRWIGFGETTTDEGGEIWHCGEYSKRYVIAFIVRKEITGSVISYTPISSRLISILISTRPNKITVIQVYAPNSDHENEEVEEFYEQLDSTTAKKNTRVFGVRRLECQSRPRCIPTLGRDSRKN